MRRTAKALILLSLLGGCTSANRGPDLGEKSRLSTRIAPATNTPTWKTYNDKPAVAQNAPTQSPNGPGASQVVQNTQTPTPSAYAPVNVASQNPSPYAPAQANGSALPSSMYATTPGFNPPSRLAIPLSQNNAPLPRPTLPAAGNLTTQAAKPVTTPDTLVAPPPGYAAAGVAASPTPDMGIPDRRTVPETKTIFEAKAQPEPIIALETKPATATMPPLPPPTVLPQVPATENNPGRSTALPDPDNYRDTIKTPAALPRVESSAPTSPATTQVSYLPSTNVEKEAARPTGIPTVRMVNSKRINLNYKVGDVGPTGVSTVELWYTQDSHTWRKNEAPAPTSPPYVAEVPGEGLYGFTLVARNGLGLGKPAPKPGDVPQVWVEVDLTKPIVTLQGVEAGFEGKPNLVVVRWSARDKNLGNRPITISYKAENGTWTPFATNVDNSGRYVWQVPSTFPNRFFVRVEAIDLAGNSAFAQSPNPVLLDMSQPTISIMSVESVGQ